MAVYRQVHTTFWQDDFVLNLTPEEKYFYLYLMTNSKTNQLGCYEIPKKVMVFETGYNLETVEKLLKRFEEYRKIKYAEDITAKRGDSFMPGRSNIGCRNNEIGTQRNIETR